MGFSTGGSLSISLSTTGGIDDTTSDSIHGKLGRDTDFGDSDIYTMLGATAKTDPISDVLTGTAGIGTWKAGAAPANAVSISEAIRYIAENIINGGTVLPATQSLYDVLAGANGIATWAAGAAPANAVSLAEGLRYGVENIINGGTVLPATQSLYDVLAGANGIATFPAAAVAANAVSMAEVLRYIQETSTEQLLTRATATTPQGTAEALFTIAGGNIELLSIVGEVTTVMGGANNTKLVFNPTGAGTSTDICAVVDTGTDAVGTLYTITGTFANAMNKGGQPFISKTAAGGRMANSITMGPGTIDLDCVGSVTGSIEWHIVYRKLEAASTVVTA